MALIDRIFHDDADEARWIANHAFSAALWFWSQGKVTRAQVVGAFSMNATDQIQLDELQAHYLSLPADQQRSFHADVESAGILAENGLLTKAQYKALLGLP